MGSHRPRIEGRNRTKHARVTFAASPEFLEPRQCTHALPQVQLVSASETYKCPRPRESTLRPRLLSMDPVLRPRRTSGRIEAITAPDHEVARSGGTTSSGSNLPSRLKVYKQQDPTPQKCIEELTRQIGHLRQELAFYREKEQYSAKFETTVLSASRAYQQKILHSERQFFGYQGIRRDERYNSRKC